MHRLIASFLISVSVFLVIFYGTGIIKENCGEMKKHLNNFPEQITDSEWENAEETAKKTSEFWNEKENIMSVFIKGDVLDDISLCIFQLTAAVNLKDRDNAIIKCAELKGLINEIEEKEKFSIMSFF